MKNDQSPFDLTRAELSESPSRDKVDVSEAAVTAVCHQEHSPAVAVAGSILPEVWSGGEGF